MKQLRLTIAKNATANIMRGGSAAIVALALPHFLTSALDHNHFAAWSLMLQIAAYATFLDFGLQTALARFLAQAMERGEKEQRDRLVSTALVLLAAAGALAFGILGIVIWELPRLFPQVPSGLAGELQVSLLIMAATAAAQLPLSAFTGVLIGLHRNEFPALAIGGSRILGAFAVLGAVHFTQSLIWLATCISVFTLLGCLVQYATVKHLLPDLRLQSQYLSSGTARELVRYCLGLTVFSLSMLVVSGLDVTIVGHFTFSAVGYYAIAATLITFVAGTSNSVFSAMMTPIAVLQARSESARIRDLVIRSTRLSSYMSLLITLPVFVYGRAALRFWVGTAYADQALPIVEILLVAQALRLTCNAYCTMLIATGQQRYGIAGALLEAITNLIASITGAVLLGPIGVAWGTLAGAAAGLLCVLLFTMHYAREVPISSWTFFTEGILRPLLVVTPVIIYLMTIGKQDPPLKSLGILLLVAILSVVLAFTSGKLLPTVLRRRLASIA